MIYNDLNKLLSENAYPGRGIAVGKSKDGKNAVVAYFIMGRSTNSRNRVFIPEGDEMRTAAFDESLLEDPSLIIYYPVRVVGGKTIVTNGDQTDTVADYIKAGKSFEEALYTRRFEPDGPNFTPRISSMIDVEDGEASYKMSILKSFGGNPDFDVRNIYSYSDIPTGTGLFIHTYEHDGNPLPSFEGEPTVVNFDCDDIDAFADQLWTSLNEDNKISLFVRFIDIATGDNKTVIKNKNQ